METSNRTRRLTKWIAALTVLALFSATIAWLITLTPTWRNRSIRFDSARWIATPSTISAVSLRQRMVDDLLRSKVLEGKTREQVLRLIGDPGETGYPGKLDMIYMLGPSRKSTFGPDIEILIITLDEAGRVVSIRLHDT